MLIMILLIYVKNGLKWYKVLKIQEYLSTINVLWFTFGFWLLALVSGTDNIIYIHYTLSKKIYLLSKLGCSC